jgi:iron(III) transport system substrate-binding protein
MTPRGCAAWLAAAAPLLVLAACGGSQASPRSGSTAGAITLYTCVSDTTIQPVVQAFEKAHPGSRIDLFRAPTGELNARVAGDVRSGGLKADVVWACDPLTMQSLVAQKLVGGWTPHTDIAPKLRTPDYVAAAVLYMVAVSHQGVKPPQRWADLSTGRFAGGVAVPDPSFAASALGALGYFAQNPDYGTGFYAALKRNGAVQVNTPDQVTNGVAEGVYKAGMTIASSAYAAKKKGSPIDVVWPQPGAIAVFGPVALATKAKNGATAKEFIAYVTSREGQTVIAGAGSYPALPGVEGPVIPTGAPVVYPDWSAVAAQRDNLVKAHRQIFGG